MIRRTVRMSGRRLAVAALALAASPAHAGPPFITDDPEPPEYGHWEINNGLTGTSMRDGGMAALPQIDANYGALPGLQLHIQPQMTYMGGPGGKAYGIGDMQLGAKYRFIDEDEHGWRPAVAVYPIFTVPLGNAQRGLGEGIGRTFLPIWAEKTIGKWTVYGGGGYGINPGDAGKNAWFVGGVALYQFTEALQFGGEIYLQTAQSPGDKDAPGFNLGGSYTLKEGLNLLFSAGTGLAHRPDTNPLSGYLALQVVY